MDELISRQAAIDELVKMLSYCFYADEEVLDAVETTLKELPSALSTNLAEVGTDLISRQQAIDVIEHITTSMSICVNSDECHGMKRMQRQAVIELANMPTIQPKRGKWIKTARWGRVYYCNQCRNYLDFDGVNAGRGSTNFCPNCGADMRGEQYG